jgi:MFS family permease
VQQENRVTWRECSKLTTFWLLAAVQGMALAVINNYLFYALHQEFHISDTLMGIVSVCRILLEIPSFYWSNSAGTLILAIVGYFYPASKKQQNEINSTNDSAPPPQQLTNINGIRWVLVFSMFLLAIRVLLYVLLLVFRWNPYVTIVIDFSHGVIYAIFYSAAVQTVALSTPEHLRTSYQGIFAAMFSGIGPCLGSIVGGIMYEKVGAVTLFLSVFLLLITAIVTYTIDIVCCARREDSKHHKRNDAESGTVEKTVSIIASK